MSDNKPPFKTFINGMTVNNIINSDDNLSEYIRQMYVTVLAQGAYMSPERLLEISDYVDGLSVQTDNHPVVAEQLEQARNLVAQCMRLLDGLGLT